MGQPAHRERAVVVTFCIAIRVNEGVVALSDTRVLRGNEMSTKSKLSMLGDGRGEAVVMTSGLRSVRDKVVARLEDELRAATTPHRRMHELATAYGQVWSADGPAPDSVVSWRTGTGKHHVVGGRPPPGAVPAEPTLEDAYLLMLGPDAQRVHTPS